MINQNYYYPIFPKTRLKENEIILYYMGMMEKTETVMRSVQDFENAEEVYKYMMHFTILL